MLQWLVLIGFAVAVGAICAFKLRGKLGAIAAAAIPWLGLLVWLLYNEYFVPYRGGGASMWPIAQLFAGTIVAIVGWCTYMVVTAVRSGDTTDT